MKNSESRKYNTFSINKALVLLSVIVLMEKYSGKKN